MKLKLTPKLQMELIETITEGNTVTCACSVCGISRETFYSWRKLGESGKPPYAEFVECLEKAENQAEAACVKLIRTAGNTSWQAAAWWLERRRPETWGKATNGKITDEHEEPHNASKETLLAKLNRLMMNRSFATTDRETDIGVGNSIRIES